MIINTNKIYSLDALQEKLSMFRKQGKIIGLCHGVFDLLHVGHVKYLTRASKMVDILIVTLTPDIHVNKGPNRPAFTEKLRAEFLAALEVVDFVAINQWPTAIETLVFLKPDFYIKGPDYKDFLKDTTGNIQREKDAIEAVGGQLVFTEEETFSSSNLLVQYSSLYTPQQREFIQKLRSQYKFEQVEEWFQKLKELKVLVVGESIIDEYVFCNALGKSGKEPVLNMQFLQKESYLGGVLAVARHLQGIGCQTEVLSAVGEDRQFEDRIHNELEQISCHFIAKKNSPTIVKRRIVDQYSQAKLLGVYEINDAYLDVQQEKEILDWFQEHLKRFDIVIVADYGHGLLTPKIIKKLSFEANYLALNTQSNSANIGFHTISKYPKADFVCIHQGELHQDYRSRFEKTDDLALRLSKKLQTKRLLITLGKEGVLGCEKNILQNCPAFASKIIDRVGAGDTVLAVTAVLSRLGVPLDLTLVLGNLAGAFAVAIKGNESCLDSITLLKSVKALL